MKKENIIKHLVEEIKRNNLSVFAGAGLSKGAGYPDWKDLASIIVDDLGLDVDKETDMISVVQYAYNKKKKNRSYINELIINRFNVSERSSKDMDILARLPIMNYWTTNYDTLIERTLNRINKVVDVKSNHVDLNNNIYNRDVVLYKIHGDVRNPSETVLTRDDYEEFLSKRGFFVDKLIGELVSSTFLFIGYSFSDPNFERILAKIRMKMSGNSRTHYYFLKKIRRDECESEDDFNYKTIKQKLQIEDLTYYNFEPILVENYSEISSFLIEVEQTLKAPNVFISGSVNDYGENWDINSAKLLIQSLSEKLVLNGNKIISGYGLGIGGYVIEGATKAIDISKNNVSEHFELFPFPQKVRNNEEPQKIWESYRKKIIGMANYAIFVFGNKKNGDKTVLANGVINEFNIANELNLKIIPIATTGFAAKKIMDIVCEYSDEYPYLIDYIEKLSNEKNRDNIINVVLEIINKGDK